MTIQLPAGWPADPLVAVTHENPFPYYAWLSRQPGHFDERIGLWVVARHNDVLAVLSGPSGRVRAPATPVPAHLAGGESAAVFGRLVRMTDGGEHGRLKAAIEPLLTSLPAFEMASAAQAAAGALRERRAGDDGALVELWMDAYPAAVVAQLCGVETGDLLEFVGWVRAIASAFGPGADQDSTTAADHAVRALAARLDHEGEASRLAVLLREALGGADDAAASANLVGWFFQAFDSCAGLIGSTIARLAELPVVDSLPTRPEVGEIVDELLRNAPPIHNTRRFLSEDLVIGDVTFPKDAIVLVVLTGGATSDPTGTRAFGAGAHRCPADRLAPAIATDAATFVWPLLTSPGDLRPIGYRPSLNARIPRFS
ncbi:MAG: hypothetical protein ABIW84_05340 [Ilumatobacteraceae bacterium]